MAFWQALMVQPTQGKVVVALASREHQPSKEASALCPRCHQPHEQEQQRDPARPAMDDQKGWKAYWEHQGFPWRTEPEISLCRQYVLVQRRAIKPDEEKRIYPFGGMQLSRADIEWLLATHDEGKGPIDWSDESQREREGIDLRGAQLNDVNLGWLPLTRMIGSALGVVSEESRKAAVLCLNRAYLKGAQLQGAILREAQLQGAILREAQLQGATLALAHLEGAFLTEAHLEGAFLACAQLEGARISGAKLQGADLQGTQLKGAFLNRAHLEGANLAYAQLEDARISGAKLRGAFLYRTQLKGAILTNTQFAGAYLEVAKLEDVDMSGANFANAQGIGPWMTDVSWGSTNMSVINWSTMNMLGVEYHARHKHDRRGKKKTLEERLADYETARRASQQFSVVLNEQGLTPDAARFAYRAKCLERAVLWYQLRTVDWQDQKTGKRTLRGIMRGLTRCLQLAPSWLFSWFLFLISGYGYRLRYCLIWYLLIISGFMLAYLITEPHYFTWWMALGESVNVFHGRGASPLISQLEHPARFALLTVIEAWMGLVIEIVLVATAVQRFFGK